MLVKSLGANKSLVTSGSVEVFVSYETPVAAKVNGEYYRTEDFWSVTTSRHINEWLDGEKAEEKPQEFFDNFLNVEVNNED